MSTQRFASQRSSAGRPLILGLLVCIFASVLAIQPNDKQILSWVIGYANYMTQSGSRSSVSCKGSRHTASTAMLFKEFT
jgi:hypothetical protein